MIKTPKKSMRARQGFTLVELMVAMALTIFVMVILTEAFVLSIDTFRGLKGIGDMQAHMRAGANVLRFDLAQNHLEGMRRVSDPTIALQPPREGFFVIYQGNASASDGLDSDSMPSFSAASHVLHMACRLKGNQQQSFYSTLVTDPTNTFFSQPLFYNMGPIAAADATLTTSGNQFFRSQWAEVAYCLAVQGSTEEPLNPNSVIGTPLYGLYRLQFLAVTDNTNINNVIPSNQGNFTGLACSLAGANVNFFTPNDLAMPQLAVGVRTRTFNPATAQPLLTNWGSSAALVVPNVLSFQVEAIQNDTNFVSTLANRPWDVPGGIYDSASASMILKGVSITLRVWDNNTRQTRQLTIIQDL